MGWQDDLSTRGQQALDSVVGDIYTFLSTQARTELVRVAQANGNLSAAQIAQGATGSNSNASVGQGNISEANLQNANQASQISNSISSMMPMLLILGAAGVAAFFILRKK